jgi:hypothetical protein
MSTISHRSNSTSSSSVFWHISHIPFASFFLHVRPKSNKLTGLIAGTTSIKVSLQCLHRVCIRVIANHGISPWSVTDPALSTHASITACGSLALCIKLPLTILESRSNTTNTFSAFRPQQPLAPRIIPFRSDSSSAHPPQS